MASAASETPLLPSEVLEHIASFINPLRARVRICSLVSKRWRAAVLRSVKSLNAIRVGEDFARLLPCIHTLRFKDDAPPVLLRSASALINLSIVTSEFVNEPFHPLAATDFKSMLLHATQLRRLRLQTYEADVWAAGVARVSAAHLHSLRLEPANGARTPMKEAMSLTYPSLTRLAFEAKLFNMLPEETEAFVRRHATQLRSLAPFYGYAPEWLLTALRDGVFPQLRKLTVCCAVAHDAILLQVVASLPASVTCVDLDLSSKSEHALALIRSAGTRLRRLALAGNVLEAQALQGALRCCTQLHTVTAEREVCLLAGEAGCPVQEVYECNLQPGDLCVLTTLRSVRLPTAVTAGDMPSARLTYLRDLIVAVASADEALLVVQQALRAAPLLQTLSLTLWCAGTPEDATVLSALCATVHGRLDSLHLRLLMQTLHAFFAEPLMAEFRKHYPWLDVTVITKWHPRRP